jgi:hypothetical protein
MHAEENGLDPKLNIPVAHPFPVILLKTFGSAQKEILTCNVWYNSICMITSEQQILRIEVMDPFEAEDNATRTSLL